MELRMDDIELGLNCCVLLRMNDADREEDWFPGALVPAHQQGVQRQHDRTSQELHTAY
jgi:hypothetical protein